MSADTAPVDHLVTPATSIGSEVDAHEMGTAPKTRPQKSRVPRFILQGFLSLMAVSWLIPMFGAALSSFRNEQDIRDNGVISFPKQLTLSAYKEALEKGLGRKFLNTAFILFPSLFLILLFSCLVGFACTRFSGRFNVTFLVIFTAGNLMPQQVIFQPVLQLFKRFNLIDELSDTNTGVLLGTKISVILIHVAFQTGFCTFVISNYMKTLPKELTEAALVDGASVNTQFWKIVLPLCRPALAALGTLEFTWLYNDFFWGSVLLNQGREKPITSAIAELSGAFSTQDSLVAAASMLIAIPTILVYLALQKHFIGGLTLGANKG
jgi:multiple sugar transport system permease protein